MLSAADNFPFNSRLLQPRYDQGSLDCYPDTPHAEGGRLALNIRRAIQTARLDWRY